MHAVKIILGISGLVILTACATETKRPVWTVKTTTESEQKIWVAKADGSVQCGPKNKGMHPSSAAEELQSAGVVVFGSMDGQDGRMHAQKCGAPTGRTVKVQISRPDLNKALALGYVTAQ